MGAALIVDRKFATFCNIARDIETYMLNVEEFTDIYTPNGDKISM